MLIKNAGTLSQRYFKSYFQLIINTRECTLEEAKDFVWKNLFTNDKNTLGSATYQNFMAAYKERKEENDLS